MKRPLILHIGLSKTGSSSIQRVLAEQRPAMREQGVYMPKSPGWANHALLPAAVVNDLRILWGYHPATWEGLSPEARIARFRDEFAAEMSALPDDVKLVIITAEQIGGVLRSQDEVDRLALTLAPYFNPIQVVVYLRRQDQHAISAYSEWLRGGTLREPGLPSGGPEQHPEYDYGGLLERWAKAFGDAAIVPRVFARDALKGGDVVADFLEIVGMALPELDESAARLSNPSLSLEGQTLLLAAGRHMAKVAPNTLWRDTPGWRRLAEAMTEAMPGRGWRPTQAEARAFMQRFAETNEQARHRFFPAQPSLFSDSFADLPEAPIVQAKEDALASALHVLLHETATSAKREAAAAMQRYHLNRRLQDRPGMRGCLVRAVKFDPDLLLARLRLAEFFIEEGDVRQAREHADAALRIAPKDPKAKRVDRQVKESLAA